MFYINGKGRMVGRGNTMKYSTTMRELDSEIAGYAELISILRKRRDEALSRMKIKCVTGFFESLDGCGKSTPIGKIIFIQTHWYVEPYSCTRGDYWKAGKGAFYCPHCGTRNRIAINRYWKNATGEELEKYEQFEREHQDSAWHLGFGGLTDNFKGVVNEYREKLTPEQVEIEYQKVLKGEGTWQY